MALPRAEELSRWTINHVTDWLAQNSLAAFRDDFLGEGIDGSKLMNLAPDDIDRKYKHIKKSKRDALKVHLRSIETHRTPPTWSTPHLPPRPGGYKAPVQPQEEEQDSEDGWDTDFEESDPEEYLEPTTGPQPQPPRPGQNEKHRPPPPLPTFQQSEYEIPDEEENVRPVHDLRRKPSIVDQLRNQLATRKSTDDGNPVAPPPRPPRRIPGDPSFPSSGLARQPQHMQTRGNAAPPEDVYEVMNDSTDQGPGTATDPPTPHKRELPKPTPEPERLPPRPSKPLPREKVARQPSPPAEQGGFLFNDPQAAGTVAPPKKDADDLRGYAWYHGKISRASATAIFDREQKDGMFLIRKSEREPNQPYTLVIWQSGRIWNIPIRKLSNNMYAAGKFKQGETQFNSIVDLVEHFKVVSLSLKSAADQAEGTNKLTIPAPKY